MEDWLARARELVRDLVARDVPLAEYRRRVRALATELGDEDEDPSLDRLLWRLGLEGWPGIQALGVDDVAVLRARTSASHRVAEDERWTWTFDLIDDAVSTWAGSRRGFTAGIDFTQRVVRACERDEDCWSIVERWLMGDDFETAELFPDPQVRERVARAIAGAGWWGRPEKLPRSPALDAAHADRVAARRMLEELAGPEWMLVEEPSPEQSAAEEAYDSANAAWYVALRETKGLPAG